MRREHDCPCNIRASGEFCLEHFRMDLLSAGRDDRLLLAAGLPARRVEAVQDAQVVGLGDGESLVVEAVGLGRLVVGEGEHRFVDHRLGRQPLQVARRDRVAGDAALARLDVGQGSRVERPGRALAVERHRLGIDRRERGAIDPLGDELAAPQVDEHEADAERVGVLVLGVLGVLAVTQLRLGARGLPRRRGRLPSASCRGRLA